MPELRWALIGLGLAFLAGLAIWEWNRSRRSAPRTPMPDAAPVFTERSRRIEPAFEAMPELHAPAPEDSFEVPVIHSIEPLPVAAESAVDVPAAARGAGGEPVVAPAPAQPAVASADLRWPPARADRVLTLRVVGRDGEQLSGRALRIALDAAGFIPGPQSIYHLGAPDGAVLVSAANLVRPGNLEPEHMDAQHFRGVSLFTVLPGPLTGHGMLEELVGAARALAQRLDAVVQDEQGLDFDGPRFAALRRSLPADAAP
ncbi:MAG: cell division protein ZipA C-terminal FtsZ-binding domain-containing protein [Steroidobacteraceae bacterium]